MADGSIGVLSAATTCAAAGIIVGIVTLTGLGLKFSADRHRFCRRQPAADRDLHLVGGLDHRSRRAGDRALHHLRGDRGARADQARRAGFRRAHVHLLLRGAVGSVAADRAVTVRGRGDHRRRSLQSPRMQAWKYTLPAFLVPFVFVLDPQGVGLLMKIPKDGSVYDIIWITLKTAHWSGRARSGRTELGLATKIPRRSGGCGCSPACCWCSRA